MPIVRGTDSQQKEYDVSENDFKLFVIAPPENIKVDNVKAKILSSEQTVKSGFEGKFPGQLVLDLSVIKNGYRFVVEGYLKTTLVASYTGEAVLLSLLDKINLQSV